MTSITAKEVRIIIVAVSNSIARHEAILKRDPRAIIARECINQRQEELEILGLLHELERLLRKEEKEKSCRVCPMCGQDNPHLFTDLKDQVANKTRCDVCGLIMDTV